MASADSFMNRLQIGRHGQIRTADLSLRRRPLYPSELRPRNEAFLILNHFDGPTISSS